MLSDMVIVFTCPGRNEANAFTAGILEPGERLGCLACGGVIVVGDDLIDEFKAVIEGLEDSVEHFIQR